MNDFLTIKTSYGTWDARIVGNILFDRAPNITCVSDCHAGAPNAVDLPMVHNAFYLGDNYDLANCRKDKADFYRFMNRQLLQKYPGRAIMGNHERWTTFDELIFINNDTVLCHGDFISWGPEKAIKYRSKPHGAGFLKRKIVVPLIEDVERFIDRSGTKLLKRAAEFAKSIGKTQIIFGHVHPKETIQTTHDGIRIVILKRGLSGVFV